MLLVFLCIIFISILGIGLLTLSSQSLKTSANERTDQSVFYTAEAGLNYASEDIQGQIKVAYENAQSSTNFLSVFKDSVDQILSNYNSANIPQDFFKNQYNGEQLVTINVTDINYTKNETDSKLVSFNIHSTGTIEGTNKKRTLQKSFEIPKNLSTVDTVMVDKTEEDNGVSKDDSKNDSKDDGKIEAIDKEEIEKGPKSDEDDIKDNENVAEIETSIYKIKVENNSNLYATRHYNFKSKIHVKEKQSTVGLSSSHKINLNPRYRYIFFQWYETAILDNTKKLWKKYEYEQSIKKPKYDSTYYPKIDDKKTGTSISTLKQGGTTITKNINMTSNQKITGLDNYKNYIFNITLNNNDTHTLTFTGIKIQNNLSNIVINVNGSGTLNINFDHNFKISFGKTLIVRNFNNAKSNLYFAEDLIIFGKAEIDGTVSVYGDFKAYFKHSIITGNLNIITPKYISPTTLILNTKTNNAHIFTNARLDVKHINVIDESASPSANLFLFGTINAEEIFTNNFNSYILARINLENRTTTVTPPDKNGEEKFEESFIPPAEIIKTSPIIEIE